MDEGRLVVKHDNDVMDASTSLIDCCTISSWRSKADHWEFHLICRLGRESKGFRLLM